MRRFFGASIWEPTQVPSSWNNLFSTLPQGQRLVIHSSQCLWFFEWESVPVEVGQTESAIAIVIGRACQRPDSPKSHLSFPDQVSLALEREQPIEPILADVDGEFVLICWHLVNHKLFLAIDPIGHQAIYYTRRPGGVIWASHPQQIVHLIGSPKIDKRALNLYFSLKGIPAPWSIFEGVYKLRPGYVLQLDCSHIEERDYWHLSQKVSTPYEDDFSSAQVNLIESLRKVVIRYVEGVSHPVGVFLSGGLDSTAITAVARKEGVPLRAFSVGYSLPYRGDESEYAALAARSLGIPIEICRFSADHMSELVHQVLVELPEPVADAALLPQLFLARHAATEIKVMLDGTGADALFGGSNKYLVEGYRQLYMRIPRMLRRGIIVPLSRALPSSRRWRITDWIRKWQIFITGCEMPENEQIVFWSRFLLPDQINRLLSPAWQDPIDIKSCVQEYQQPVLDEIGTASYITLKCIIPWVELRKLSAIEQDSGISIRKPFLSPLLVEFGLCLPGSYKVQNGKGKVVLRKACEGLVPPPILQRRKANFVPPISQWIGSALREMFWDTLSQDAGLLNLQTVQSMLREHTWGWRDWSSELWAIFVLQSWVLKNTGGAVWK